MIEWWSPEIDIYIYIIYIWYIYDIYIYMMSYFEVHQKLIYDMTCIDMLTIPGMDPIGIWDLLSLFLNIQYICICHILKITPSRNSFTIEDIQTWLCDTFWTTLWSAEVPYGAWGCHSAPKKNQPELITPCYTMIYHVPMAHSPTPSVPCINHRIPDSFASASLQRPADFMGTALATTTHRHEAAPALAGNL